MFAVDCWFASRSALGEALLPSFEEGGVFLEGAHGITSGSPATLRVGVQGLRVGVFLEGIVQWRRAPSRIPGATATPAKAGTGVRLLPDQRERFAFLQDWSSGEREESGRTEWRFPFEQRALPTTGLSGRTARMMHARIRDVSRHGALLSTPGSIAVGTVITVDVMLTRDAVASTARVVRSGESFVALRIESPDAASDERWGRLVAIADEAFQRRLDAATPNAPARRR